MVKAMTLYFVVLTPMASAAISFSRIAMQARPCVEFTKFLMTKSVARSEKNTQGKVVRCGMPEKPAAPPTYWIFISTMRIISERPSVAIAR